LDRRHQGRPAGTARRQAPPLHERIRPVAIRRGRADLGAGQGPVFRGRREGPRRQAGVQL
ncbi:hypothetical protein LTR94_038777, partial [Friedmanniomyces endolithicus]